MTEWRDHLWTELCFGDHIHPTSWFHGKVFPIYIYTHTHLYMYARICVSTYICVLSNIYSTRRQMNVSQLTDAVFSLCSDTFTPSTQQKWEEQEKLGLSLMDWKWWLILAVPIPLDFIASLTIFCYISFMGTRYGYAYLCALYLAF